MLAALLVACAVFSPLAHSQATDGESESPAARYPYIFIATADGSHVWPLTAGRRPAWSPGGWTIAFYRERADFMKGDMFFINLDGSMGRWVGPGIEPSWPPDDEKIVFTSSEGIAVRDLNLGLQGVTTLLRHDFLAGLPFSEGGTYAPWDMGVGKAAWSPDGKLIAFEHLGDGDMVPAQIYLMNADGTNVQRLSSSPDVWFSESDPAWSPDGLSIALWSYGHGLATIRLSDSSVRTVYHDFPAVAYGARPAWSPDGTRIAFVANDGRTGERSIWVVDSLGGSPSELIPNAYDPAWSPNGNYIAFVSDLPEPAPLPAFPLVSRPASIYYRDSVHMIPLDARSRYVLFDNNTFEIQYALAEGAAPVNGNGANFSYHGTYVRTESEIELDFESDSRWQAHGSFSDDEGTLSVVYNPIMSLSDFEDGIYVLAGQSPEGPVKQPDEPQDPPPGEPQDPLLGETQNPPPPPKPGCGLRCSSTDK